MTSALLTLSIDTATRTQVIALLRGTVLLGHMQYAAKYDHGSSLLGAIDQMCATQEVHPRACDLIVVGLGPGSFTGLRVGLATAKGLARGASCALVGASSLQAMAYRTCLVHPGVPVWSAMDANRGEIYAGAYVGGEAGQLEVVVREQAWRPGALREALGAQGGHVVPLVHQPLMKYPELLAFLATDPRILVLSGPWAQVDGAALGALGQRRFEAAGGDDLHTLEPHYIRPSDAELKFGKTKKGPPDE